MRNFQLPGRSPVLATNGMASTSHPLATTTALNVLRDGGNAVDAAIAVQLTLAVTWPEAGNIGGGGFMMIHPPGDKDVVCVAD